MNGIIIKSIGGLYFAESSDGCLLYTSKMLRLTEDYLASPEKFSLTAKQKQLADILEEKHDLSMKEACYLCGVGKTVAQKLVEKCAAEEYEQETYRIVKIGEKGKSSIVEIVLSESQQKVYDRVKSQMNTGEPK